jgi:formate C-acetyltransferase
VNDCISKGKDIDHGGARYDWNEMSFVGLANLADSLAAIEQFVFDEKSLTLDDLRKALDANYEGNEELRLKILNRAPKYGNADDRVDRLAKVATEWAHGACSKNRIYPDSEVVAGFFCWVMHEYLGRETGASADGRLCGFPLGDGSGPAQGRERQGPTSAVISTTSWDHTPMLGGIALNLKFTPGRNRAKFVDSLTSLIDTYCDRGGFEVQVNVVDNATLLKAQKNPEQYRDLVVRIGGYSDYFVGLSPEMQAEVIARFEHSIG